MLKTIEKDEAIFKGLLAGDWFVYIVYRLCLNLTFLMRNLVFIHCTCCLLNHLTSNLCFGTSTCVFSMFLLVYLWWRLKSFMVAMHKNGGLNLKSQDHIFIHIGPFEHLVQLLICIILCHCLHFFLIRWFASFPSEFCDENNNLINLKMIFNIL